MGSGKKNIKAQTTQRGPVTLNTKSVIAVQKMRKLRHLVKVNSWNTLLAKKIKQYEFYNYSPAKTHRF